MNLSLSTEEKNFLYNKTVVITGTTGGLGRALCKELLSCKANLVMVNRNQSKTQSLTEELKNDYPKANIHWYLCDLSSMKQVKELTEKLQLLPIDILILNAGIYAIKRTKSDVNFDTVFQTNFLSHYYMVKTLFPLLSERKAKVVVTGSIAHRFHSIDIDNPDFSNHRGVNGIYGNSKRFLMFSLMGLLLNSPVSFAIGHPGISPTGITGNYPPLLLKIVKPAMRLLFMPPEKACQSIFFACCKEVPYGCWIGPKFFDIWGTPTCKKLHSCSPKEQTIIFLLAEKMVSSNSITHSV